MVQLKTRSGKRFSYIPPNSLPAVPIVVMVHTDGAMLLQAAMDKEDLRAGENYDDSEGAVLSLFPPEPSSRPPSPQPRHTSPTPSMLSSDLSSVPPSPMASRPPTPDPRSRSASPALSVLSSELSSVPPSPKNSRPSTPDFSAPPRSRGRGPVDNRRRLELSKERRRKNRANKKFTSDPLARPRLKASHRIAATYVTHKVVFDTEKLEGSGASYTGRKLRRLSSIVPNIKRLQRAGIKIREWDGM